MYTLHFDNCPLRVKMSSVESRRRSLYILVATYVIH